MITKLIRSLTVVDTAETQQITDNYKHVQSHRLLGLGTTEQACVDHIMDFYQANGGPPQASKAIAFFEGNNEADSVRMFEEAAALQPYFGPSFKTFFEEEVERLASEELVQTLKTGIKIATTGHKIGKTTVKGTDEAISYIYTAAKAKPPNSEGRPPSNMKTAADYLDKLYLQRKNSPADTYGIMTGYGLFDRATAGIRKKQLRLHVGFGGHLKSTCMLNEIVNAAVAGWNPLTFTSEMPQDEMMYRLIAIHSADPKFNGVGKPLHAFRLSLGALNPQEEAFYATVKDDLLNNSQHGTIRVIDSGEFTTWGSVMQRTLREHAELEVDELWCDYITRLPIDTKYKSMTHTEAVNETIADAKRFAMAFDGGIGLPVNSPFQMNREGYKAAKANEGQITKTALAQYNAAEKEADIITYVWFDVEEQQTSEPKLGVLKSRYGKEEHEPKPVFIEPDSRRIFDMTSGMSVGAPTTGGGSGESEVVL